MKTALVTLIAIAVALVPTYAFAGGPPGDSPEPSFWILALLGALPLVGVAAWQLRAQRQQAAVAAQREP